MEKYCPECKMTCGTATCPIETTGRCKRCGKPAINAADRDRAWVWCSQHDRWHTAPCAEDAGRHCCTPAAA